jgi:hypothetical protein
MVNGNITPLLNIICKISRNRREPLPSFRLGMNRQPAVEESGSFVDRVGTPFEWIAVALQHRAPTCSYWRREASGRGTTPV